MFPRSNTGKGKCFEIIRQVGITRGEEGWGGGRRKGYRRQGEEWRLSAWYARAECIAMHCRAGKCASVRDFRACRGCCVSFAEFRVGAFLSVVSSRKSFWCSRRMFRFSIVLFCVVVVFLEL